MPKMLVNLDMTQNAVINVADPVNGQDAANKRYVDSVAQGLDVKESVRVATTANIALTGTPAIDGVTVAIGDRVLVKNQTAAIDNGVYIVTAAAWTRAADYAAGAVAAGSFTFIEEGATQSDSGWVCTSDKGSDVVATNTLEYSQFSGAGTFEAGNGLQKIGSVISVLAPATSGLTAAVSGLTVNVDNSTIEISGNNLQVVAGGISSNELAIGAVTAGNQALDASVAGDGLSLASGVLSVNVGAGLVITSDIIELDTASGYGVRKFVESITGAGTVVAPGNIKYTVTHNLGTLNVQVGLFDNATGEVVYADVVMVDSTKIDVHTAVAIGAITYVVTVIG